MNINRVFIIFFLLSNVMVFTAELVTNIIRKGDLSQDILGIYSLKNTRGKSQQDRALYAPVKNGHLFCVFDGHSGDEVVDYLCNNYDTKFAELSEITFDSITALYKQIDQEVQQLPSGSTACCVFIPNNQQKVYFINVGDSTALLINQDGVIDFETDAHTPYDDDEAKRIQDKGGDITYRSDCFYIDYNNKFLAVSRSFGDTFFKEPGIVIVDPGIHEKMVKDNQLILIGTDGAFEEFTQTKASQLISERAREKKSPQEIVTEIVTKAHDRDDSTALLINLGALFSLSKDR